MYHQQRVLRRFGAALLLAVAGCASLGRDSPPLEQYVLGAGRPPGAAVPSPEGAGMRIGIRRIDVAPYLATSSIVVRHGAHRIMVSDFHRWGEALGAGIGREVARQLAAAGLVHAVDVAPWPVRAPHDYLVQVHVSRFEGLADSAAAVGGARVAASWQIIRPADGVVLARGATDVERQGWRVDDYAALVLMLEDGLERLSGDLLACLARVQSRSPPEVAGAAAARSIICGPGGAP